MDDTAIAILDTRRVMAVSTVRPDGWPQTTIVGYANVGLRIYFVIFRSSQKFANITRDNRIALAVGEEPRDISELQAVYASSRAVEVTDDAEREAAWRLLGQRHPNIAGSELPDSADAVMMRADCENVAVLDYTKGFGHSGSLLPG